jgi:hypothetical protein
MKIASVAVAFVNLNLLASCKSASTLSSHIFPRAELSQHSIFSLKSEAEPMFTKTEFILQAPVILLYFLVVGPIRAVSRHFFGRHDAELIFNDVYRCIDVYFGRLSQNNHPSRSQVT